MAGVVGEDDGLGSVADLELGEEVDDVGFVSRYILCAA